MDEQNTEKAIKDLQKEISSIHDALNNSYKLDKFSPREDIDSAKDIIYEALSDVFFERVNFLNNPDTVVSTATTSTTQYRTLLRVPDTTGGKYLRPDKKSRFRSCFYVSGGVENADFYILSPAMYRSASLASDISNFNTFDSYVGIRCNSGRVSLESKSRGQVKSIPVSTILVSNTSYVIEILFHTKTAQILLDGLIIGNVACDLTEFSDSIITMFPIFAPIRSTTAVSVNLNAENYQFIQEK